MLDSLYEGLLDEDAWQRALMMITDFVSGSCAALYSLNPQTGRMFRSDLVRVDPTLLQQYQNNWILEDSRYVAGLSCPVGEPQVDAMLVDMRTFHRTEVYNDFLRPADIPYLLSTWVERKPTRGVVLGIQASRNRGAFTEEERRRVALLIPHLRRVVETKDRLACASTTAENILDSMDRLPFGFMLLSDTLEILEASACSRRLFTSRDGLHADQGHLGFPRHDDAQAFAKRLREEPTRAALDDVILIRRSGQRPSLSLQVLPLTPSQEHWLRPAARWMVLVFDPESGPALPELVLQKTLGISAAEATLARLLAHGWSLSRAADHLGISRHTVRTQLKSIYAKTGLNSQAQLVRRIMTSPAMLGQIPR